MGLHSFTFLRWATKCFVQGQFRVIQLVVNFGTNRKRVYAGYLQQLECSGSPSVKKSWRYIALFILIKYRSVTDGQTSVFQQYQCLHNLPFYREAKTGLKQRPSLTSPISVMRWWLFTQPPSGRRRMRICFAVVFWFCFFCFVLFFSVHQNYETTVLGNGWTDFHETFTKRWGECSLKRRAAAWRMANVDEWVIYDMTLSQSPEGATGGCVIQQWVGELM